MMRPEFTDDDLMESGTPAVLDLGDYAVTNGTEFELEFRLTAPALASWKVPLTYDRALLELVKESVKPRKLPSLLRS